MYMYLHGSENNRDNVANKTTLTKQNRGMGFDRTHPLTAPRLNHYIGPCRASILYSRSLRQIVTGWLYLGVFKILHSDPGNDHPYPRHDPRQDNQSWIIARYGERALIFLFVHFC